jgi:pilus assembly protein FimV
LQLVAPDEEVGEEAIEGTAAPGAPAPDADNASEETRNLQQQLAMAAEEAEASRARSGELQTRVTELEDQVTNMQRLLELKDAQLASLQNRLDVVEENTPPAETGVTGETAAASDETGPDSEATTDAEESRAMDEPNGLIDRLLDNPVLTALGVLVAMILGGFLWASTRQRKHADLFSDEPTLASRLAETLTDREPASPGIIVNENRAFSELPGEDISPLTSDAESDPMTEADVFIAYGRVQQAEDVIKGALQKDPENLDLKVKLMEVYHAAGNAAAFDTHAEGFRRQVDQDDPLWMKVAAMGYELSPENPAYKIAADASKTDTDVDFDMDLSGMEEIDQAPESEATVDEDLGLDYVERDQAANELPEKMDFNLDEREQVEMQPHTADEDALEGILDSADEVSTKLDLARAYIDMGDPDSARNILEEVLEEGTSDQKHEAEDLVSQLA